MITEADALPGGLLTFGESMGLISAVDIGSVEFARQFRYGIRGAESNVAIGTARLGASATWTGRLGRDATGDMIERRLHAEGVYVHAIRDDGFTGMMLRHQRLAGHLSVDYHRARSAGSRLRRTDIPDQLLDSASILHVTGITPALSESARDAVFDAVRRARSMGVIVSLGVNYRAKLWAPEAARRVLTELAACSDILMAGAAEASLLIGEPTRNGRDLTKALAGLGPADVIVRDGGRGCIALIDGVFASCLRRPFRSLTRSVLATRSPPTTWRIALLASLQKPGCRPPWPSALTPSQYPATAKGSPAATSWPLSACSGRTPTDSPSPWRGLLPG